MERFDDQKKQGDAGAYIIDLLEKGEVELVAEAFRHVGKKEEKRRAIELKAARKAYFLKFIFTSVFVIFSIGFLMILWNVHPILGLLGLVLFVWLIKNKWDTDTYFRYGF